MNIGFRDYHCIACGRTDFSNDAELIKHDSECEEVVKLVNRKRGWISIKDRLPEKGFCGLVYPNSVGVVGTGCFLGYEGEPGYWAWSDNEDRGEPIAPWYWQPFPDEPENATNPYLIK